MPFGACRKSIWGTERIRSSTTMARCWAASIPLPGSAFALPRCATSRVSAAKAFRPRSGGNGQRQAAALRDGHMGVTDARRGQPFAHDALARRRARRLAAVVELERACRRLDRACRSLVAAPEREHDSQDDQRDGGRGREWAQPLRRVRPAGRLGRTCAKKLAAEPRDVVAAHLVPPARSRSTLSPRLTRLRTVASLSRSLRAMSA
jgi:hypothetical protein